MDKTGKYLFLAEPFHCDFSHRLFLGHLGNHMLNAADFHSTERGFGMTYLNTINKTWVLSRLAIEVCDMPMQYTKFFVETWVESAMKYFTNRNFKVTGEDGHVYGYGRSVWAMIDTVTRQPQDILDVNNGDINKWIEVDKPCPIGKISRVKMGNGATPVRTIDTFYSDVDVNGHINSVKYIEHVLDLFDLDWHRKHAIKRFEIAYVAESHQGDKLSFSMEEPEKCSGEQSESECYVRITKTDGTAEGTTDGTEVCRSRIVFTDK